MATIATLIVNVAANQAQLIQDVQKIHGTLDGVGTVARRVGSILAGAFTLTAIVSAGRQVIDFASHLTDLSQRTGWSTTALQRMDIAFKASGVNIDTVVKATEKLSKSLVGGDASAVVALNKMGLSVADLKRMAPDQMFLTVADAVGKIQNPAEKSFAAMTVFGKGGSELLAGLNGHLAETVQRAEELGLVISEDTLEAADDFGDSLGVMGTQLLAVTANIMGPLLPGLSSLLTMLINITHVIGGVTSELIKWAYGGLLAAASAIEKFLAWIAEAVTKIPLLGKHLGFAADAADWLRRDAGRADEQLVKMFTSTSNVGAAAHAATGPLLGLGKASEEAAKAAKAQAEALEAIRLASIPLTASQQQLVIQWDKLGVSNDKMAKALGISADAIKRFLDGLEVLKKDIPVVAAGVADFAALFPTQVRSGTEEIQRMAIAFGVLKEQVESLRDAKLEDFGIAIDEIPPKLSRVQQAAIDMAEAMSRSIADNLAAAVVSFQSFKDVAVGIWNAFRQEVQNILSDLLTHFIRQFILGMLNSMLSSQGSFTSAFSTMFGGFGGIMKGLTSLFSSSLLGWVGLAAAVIGVIASKIKGLFRGGEEGVVVNPARDTWFESQGGLPGVNEGLMNAGLSWAETEKIAKAIFDADTKKEFDAAVAAYERARRGGGGAGIVAGSNHPEIPDVHWGGAMAGGGTGMVTRPTLFLAGESGPEEYAFRRAGSRSSSQPTQTTIINNSYTIQAIDTQSAEQFMEKRGIPFMTNNVRDNRMGSRTRLREALGVT